jgi:leader peptidase (prepilin peptidase)/N-methyltransferase
MLQRSVDTGDMPVLFLFILGLLVGSFVNVLIDRLPKGENVLWGRSRCDFCKKTLRWYELMPVVSFMFQQGRCLRCRKKLSVQYPLIELVTAIGFVLLCTYPLSFYLLFISLLVIFVADLKYQIIPDSMIVLGCAAVLIQWIATKSPGDILHYVVTGLACFAAFYLLWLVTRGKGIGFGDVKFAPLMGVFLGFPGVVSAFYVAFLTGAFAGVILMVGRKKTWKSKIAFGPFLVVGTVAAWVWQPQFTALWRMYL